MNKSDAVKEFVKCAKSPSYMLEKYGYLKDIQEGKTKWVPYDWQVELLDLLHQGKSVVILKSRQVGASWTIAFYVVWLLHFKPDISISLISRNLHAATRLLEKVKFIAYNLPDFIKLPIIKDTQTSFAVAHSADGKSYSIVDSLTTTSGSGRGDTTAFVFCDEFAHVARDREVWASILPTTSRGGQIVVASSPRGPDNTFATIWMEAESGMSDMVPFRVHYSQCGFDEEWLKKVSKGMTKEQISQEFELSFVGGGIPAFDPEDLRNCYIPMEDILNNPEYADIKDKIEKSNTFYTGVDTAVIRAGTSVKRRDYNAIVTFNEFGIQVASEANHKKIDEWAGNTVDGPNGERVEMIGFVSKWHRKYPGEMVVEANGPGLTVLNRHVLPDDGVSSIVGITTSHKRKMRLVEQFRLAIAGRRVIITDAATYYQLMRYQDLGDGKFSAPSGFYDDLVIATLIAYDAYVRAGGYILKFDNVDPEGYSGKAIAMENIRDRLPQGIDESYSDDVMFISAPDLGDIAREMDYEFFAGDDLAWIE